MGVGVPKKRRQKTQTDKKTIKQTTNEKTTKTNKETGEINTIICGIDSLSEYTTTKVVSTIKTRKKVGLVAYYFVGSVLGLCVPFFFKKKVT